MQTDHTVASSMQKMVEDPFEMLPGAINLEE